MNKDPGPRPRGRPSVGDRVSLRVARSVLDRIDAHARQRHESRASAVRALLEEALDARADGVDRAQIRRMLDLTPRERIRHMAEVTDGLARFRERTRAQG